MIGVCIFIIIVGALLLFWTGLFLGHVEGLTIGLILIVIGVVILLFKTGDIELFTNYLSN